MIDDIMLWAAILATCLLPGIALLYDVVDTRWNNLAKVLLGVDVAGWVVFWGYIFFSDKYI